MPRRLLTAVLALLSTALLTGLVAAPGAQANELSRPKPGHVRLAGVHAALVEGDHRIVVTATAVNHSGRTAPYERMVVLLKPVEGGRATYLGPVSVPHLAPGHVRVLRRSLSARAVGLGRYRTYLCRKSHVNNACAHSASTLVVPASELKADAARLDFGRVQANGRTVTKRVLLTDTGPVGTGRLHFFASRPFTVNPYRCPLALIAHHDCPVFVTYTPNAAGPTSGRLVMWAGHGGRVTVPLTGTGVAAQALQVSPTSTDFGDVAAMQTSTRDLTVTNDGTGPSGTISLTTSGPFSVVDDDCATLTAGQSCTATVQFAPGASGSYSGTVTASDGQASSTASLQGQGVAGLSVDQTGLDFGTVPVDTTSDPQTVTVSNDADASQTLLDHEAAAPFAIVGGSCVDDDWTVPAQGSCTVQVVFEPTDTDAASGILKLSNVDYGFYVRLYGTGS